MNFTEEIKAYTVVEDTKEFLSSRELDKAFVTRFAAITQGAGLVPNQSYTLT